MFEKIISRIAVGKYRATNTQKIDFLIGVMDVPGRCVNNELYQAVLYLACSGRDENSLESLRARLVVLKNRI